MMISTLRGQCPPSVAARRSVAQQQARHHLAGVGVSSSAYGLVMRIAPRIQSELKCSARRLFGDVDRRLMCCGLRPGA